MQLRIEVVRQQLYELIDENANYDSIVNKSIELDLLINCYYHVGIEGIC